MENFKMDIFTKNSIAVEILFEKIADMFRAGYTVEDKEVQELLKEREELYSCNEKLMDKIISVYGAEIKKKFENI